MKKNIFLLILIITIIAIFAVGCATEDENDGQSTSENVIEDEEGTDETEDTVIEEDEDPVEENPVEEEPVEEEPVMAPELITLDENGEEVLLKNLAGEDVSLADYRGKIVFLNFWATWCGYCDAEMPDLQRLENENDDVAVIAVDVKEDQALVEEYIQEGGYEFEVVLDTDGIVAQEYLISAFPTTYVIREDGTISRWFPGMLTYEQMEELLEIARTGQ